MNLEEYRYSERGVLRPGDIFRARGGPTYRKSNVGRPGLYKLLGVLHGTPQRTYLLAMHVDKNHLPSGGSALLYVRGRPYRLAELPSWVVRTYSVSKVRQKKSRDRIIKKSRKRRK